MPLVIDEVVIHVDVANAAGSAPPPAAAAPLPQQERQALVAEVVEQVLDVLRQRQEP